jgi:hypothetical protein
MRVEPMEVGPCVVVFGIGEEGGVDIVNFGVGGGWRDVSEKEESMMPT